MYETIIKNTNQIIKKYISEENLDYMQDMLIQLKIYLNIIDLLTYILWVSFILLMILMVIILLFNLPVILMLFSSMPILLFLTYIFYKRQKRLDSIDEDLPDYLLQIASLLNAGMSLETSFDEVSKNMDGYLNDEVKRALIEIRMGKSFNEAFIDITKRCNLYNLNKAIQIIINTKESGGNLSEILELLSGDIKETQLLKRNKKSSVMMSVMFLLISAVIATPFSFSTIGVYSKFLESVGRPNPLMDVIPIASIGYIIIHSILVSLLIAIVMDSNYRKSIKWIVIILPLALGVFYISQILITVILRV